jgi:hypothetical protein
MAQRFSFRSCVLFVCVLVMCPMFSVPVDCSFFITLPVFSNVFKRAMFKFRVSYGNNVSEFRKTRCDCFSIINKIWTSVSRFNGSLYWYPNENYCFYYCLSDIILITPFSKECLLIPHQLLTRWENIVWKTALLYFFITNITSRRHRCSVKCHKAAVQY